MTAIPRLRHVVLLGFKPAVGPKLVEEAMFRFAALPESIVAIEAFEWGTNVSGEGLDRGRSHCVTLTFGSEADRDAYLLHPDHVAFGEWVRPHLETVTVVDYWAREVR